MQFNEPVASDSPATHCHSVEDILTREPCYYCIVDASWKSPHERAGIGWSLYSRQGTLIKLLSMESLQSLQQTHRLKLRKWQPC